jgi:hypothetical protein
MQLTAVAPRYRTVSSSEHSSTLGQKLEGPGGLETFATLSNGERILTPACYRTAER